jgi:hypothetical protein
VLAMDGHDNFDGAVSWNTLMSAASSSAGTGWGICEYSPH